MFDKLKQPIMVETPVGTSGTAKYYDDNGDLKSGYNKPIELVEPIVKWHTSTDSVDGYFETEGGGAVEISENQWVSRHFEFEKNTRVTVEATGDQYFVLQKGPDEVAGLMTYYLKAVD